MPMVLLFTLFAVGAGLLGWWSPHVVHRLGYKMMVLYLALAAAAALIGAMRRTR